jgi:inorganic pyrophosphatase
LIFRASATVENAAERVDPAQVAKIPKGENLAPAPIDPSVDKWFYISGAAM